MQNLLNLMPWGVSRIERAVLLKDPG
jgi:hypothetical protein